MVHKVQGIVGGLGIFGARLQLLMYASPLCGLNKARQNLQGAQACDWLMQHLFNLLRDAGRTAHSLIPNAAHDAEQPMQPQYSTHAHML